MKIIGLDPGRNGAMSVYDSETGSIETHLYPFAGKEFDCNAFASLLKEIRPDVAVIEKVNASPVQGRVQGGSSMFTFGMGYGMIRGILSALDVSVELTTPQAWKKEVLAGSNKDKDAAIAYCRRAYPTIPLVPPRCRTPHDGIADSLCIMTYGIRKFLVTNQKVA